MQQAFTDPMTWIVCGAVVALILGIRYWYASRRHGFKASDGARFVWHPGGGFTDGEGAAVTDPARIQQLTQDWEAIAARTQRQTATIMKWRFLIMAVIGLAGLGGGGFYFFSQPKVAELDCPQISDQAKSLYDARPPAITEISDVREVSRTAGDNGELRCTGHAKFVDGSEGLLYMRAYRSEGNIMISASGSGFE
jgi:hypothetical protein